MFDRDTHQCERSSVKTRQGGRQLGRRRVARFAMSEAGKADIRLLAPARGNMVELLNY
jgi:hypothetical protein